MIKEKRRRKRRFKKILLAILSFILFLGIAALIVVKVFVVEKVEVSGNKLYDESVIKDTLLEDEYSWNSLYVYFKYLFADTSNIPFVDTVEVTLEDPHTLHIEVYEKGMVGYLYIPGIDENAYFDKDGIVIETSSRVIENVPKIEGVTCDEVVLYEKLPISKEILQQILQLSQALKREKMVPESIVYGEPDEPVLDYGDVWVSLGDLELLTQKVERMAKIKPSLENQHGILHLEDWTEESTNIRFEIIE